MTTKRQYECNFCRNGIMLDVGAGRGLEWVSGTDLQFVSLTAAENHLCTACIGAFRRLLTSVCDPLSQEPEK